MRPSYARFGYACIFFALLCRPVQATGADTLTSRDSAFQRDIETMFPQWVKTRRELHRHPELSNQEERTAALVARKLRELGLEVQTGVGGHGVVAVLKGLGEGAASSCVAVRADMDALPITESRESEYRSQTPGVMHACGHDVHVTCALGVAELLSRHRDQFPGTVKFIFQPAEEAMPATFVGDWGAKRMLAEGALDNPRPSAIFGLHCSPLSSPKAGPRAGVETPLEVGKVGYSIGPASANSDRFHIVIRGKIAHGSAPHKGVDAIAVAGHAITALQMIRSRETNTREPIVISIGMIQGGTRENIISDRVEMSGTVRSYDIDTRDQVIELMHRTLAGVTAAHGATYELNYRKGYPSIHNDPELAQAALATMRRVLGEDALMETIPGMGGEDFSYFANVIPGFYFRLGVANVQRNIVAGVHT
ncbi:MAG: M20 metallopeptidase family protein, partial [Planctomycetaceae bacterium]